MKPDRDTAALALARLRQNGWLPAKDLPLAEAEERASQTGRRIFLTRGDDGPPFAVLGWEGTEPAASSRVPRLARRELSRRATKTLIVVYALITDPQASRAIATVDQVLAAIEMLTAKPGNTWAITALQQELPQVGLVVQRPGGWHLGPRVEAWDLPTREIMTHAARQLRAHPGWAGTRDT